MRCIGLMARFSLLPLLLCLLISAYEPSTAVHSAATENSLTLSLTPFASGFTQPTAIANAGDDRLFIVERRGLIHVVAADGDVLPAPFLDIQTVVTTGGGEQGLLGLAFHPNYPDTPYFYINYTASGSGDSIIARYEVSDVDTADPASEVALLTVAQPQANHNGGDLHFGPNDGYLYLSLGDGGGAGDSGAGHGQFGNGQNRNALLGKILRLDVDGDAPYAIPPDNPFVGEAGARDEIWAWGLRNPWRFSFDRLTGDLYIADVGQVMREEINFQPADSPGGENYGWRCYEGNLEFNLAGCGPRASYVFPIFDYGRDDGRAVTGGFVYRGSQSPALIGRYVFADYLSANVWTIRRNDDCNWVTELEGPLAGLNRPSAFGEDAAGELYVADYNSGAIFHIEAEGPALPHLPYVLYLPLITQAEAPCA